MTMINLSYIRERIEDTYGNQKPKVNKGQKDKHFI
jgi:hypothetical protein